MWDLPGPGIEPVSPALAGGFLTTAPSGKSLCTLFYSEKCLIKMLNCMAPYCVPSSAAGAPWLESCWLIVKYSKLSCLLVTYLKSKTNSGFNQNGIYCWLNKKSGVGGPKVGSGRPVTKRRRFFLFCHQGQLCNLWGLVQKEKCETPFQKAGKNCHLRY